MAPFASVLSLLAVCLSGCVGVSILELKVPAQVQAGETVHLTCRYDLEGAALYSLSWWRGTEQFYQYSPNTPGHITTHDSRGITVDKDRSGENVVVLRNVTFSTAGKFKCEVMTKSFAKDSEQSTMEVIDVPSRPPTLVLERVQWSPGEVLEANCSSPGARPPPQLHWYINGNKVTSQYSQVVTESVRGYVGAVGWVGYGSDVGASTRTSALKMLLSPTHFSQNGRATLTCAATLPGLYHRSAEVFLTVPGFRAAAPSQKLYGTARRHSSTSIVVTLGLAVLRSASWLWRP